MGLFDKLFGNSKPVVEPKPVPPAQHISREQIMAKLAPHRRRTYLPLTEQRDNTFSSYSKMGGFPYLRNESDWPICPNCSNHMQLFVQLDMSNMPERKSNGLIQLFYCTNSEKNCDTQNSGYEPFSVNSVCRHIEIKVESAIIEPVIEEVFPEQQITAWEAKDDYPSTDEYEELGVDLDLSEETYDIIEKENLNPHPGDKLFGWPLWVQSVEYPGDRKTGRKMELLFQVDSEINLPYMFGDGGIGHLTQSPDDENELAFGWACY